MHWVFKFEFIFSTCVGVFACLYVCVPYTDCPLRSKKKVLDPWDQSYRLLGAAKLVLWIKRRPSGRANSALNHWAISSSLRNFYFSQLPSKQVNCIQHILTAKSEASTLTFALMGGYFCFLIFLQFSILSFSNSDTLSLSLSSLSSSPPLFLSSVECKSLIKCVSITTGSISFPLKSDV